MDRRPRNQAIYLSSLLLSSYIIEVFGACGNVAGLERFTRKRGSMVTLQCPVQNAIWRRFNDNNNINIDGGNFSMLPGFTDRLIILSLNYLLEGIYCCFNSSGHFKASIEVIMLGVYIFSDSNPQTTTVGYGGTATLNTSVQLQDAGPSNIAAETSVKVNQIESSQTNCYKLCPDGAPFTEANRSIMLHNQTQTTTYIVQIMAKFPADGTFLTSKTFSVIVTSGNVTPTSLTPSLTPSPTPLFLSSTVFPSFLSSLTPASPSASAVKNPASGDLTLGLAVGIPAVVVLAIMVAAAVIMGVVFSHFHFLDTYCSKQHKRNSYVEKYLAAQLEIKLESRASSSMDVKV